ncbi:hypothetical protein HMH01_05490 [Halovulum dunhuangense]|uniref:Uncharacterized protein n=1 Tax=Halovulum dunhuangense TaxID=1505036 RepID=A0A849L0V6_9RHOB|nr:hypothetical protein [Halovulum dunhuangense]NNU79890.1 hypothetical protein [Halovulum dunhuangense]
MSISSTLKVRRFIELDLDTQRAISALIDRLKATNAFGIDFPATCNDSGTPCGTDEALFDASLYGMVPDLKDWKSQLQEHWHRADEDRTLPSIGVVFDALEWCAQHVGKPASRGWHDYYKHDHLRWDRATGLEDYISEVNAIFGRKGIAYEMRTDGRIYRLVDAPAAEILGRARFQTGDRATDDLLETARTRFFDRDPSAGQDAIEKLWDAFERVKTLELHTNKKFSVEQLIERVASSPEHAAMLDAEMKALTDIGNEWRIRHHEIGKTDLGENRQLKDYLFLRLFSLLYCLLVGTSRLGADA